jgi:hypothetical protein
VVEGSGTLDIVNGGVVPRPKATSLYQHLARWCTICAPASAQPQSSAMQSSADECWRIAAECGHWAEESHDEATRLAFRQMAKAWAQLAFGQDFTPPDHKPLEPQGSESSETIPEDGRIRHRFR